jgi:hypothetical protein
MLSLFKAAFDASGNPTFSFLDLINPHGAGQRIDPHHAPAHDPARQFAAVRLGNYFPRSSRVESWGDRNRESGFDPWGRRVLLSAGAGLEEKQGSRQQGQNPHSFVFRTTSSLIRRVIESEGRCRNLLSEVEIETVKSRDFVMLALIGLSERP